MSKKKNYKRIKCKHCGNKYSETYIVRHIRKEHPEHDKGGEPGAPTKYKPEYCDKVDEYLKKVAVDKEYHRIKQENAEKGYVMYDNKLQVNLPTKEGFSIYIDVALSTLYEWEKEHEEFSDALGRIKANQKERLQNMGLSGEYNSKIAALILSSNHNMAEKKEHSGTIALSKLAKEVDEEE